MLLNITEWGSEGTRQAVHMSRRHVLPLLLVSIYWVGDGFLTVYDVILKKVQSQSWLTRFDSRRKSQILFTILLILFMVPFLVKILRPQRVDRLPEKWAGLWMKDHYGKEMTIFTTVPLVAYYANGNPEYVDAKKDTVDRVKTSMAEKKAFYLVIREKEMVYFPAEAIEKSFIQINRFEGKGMEKVIVYQRVN
jgi:hypothetical protein